MLKVLKFNTKDQNVWFSADYHWHHQRDFVWKSRGFNSSDEHDKYLINITNELVKENDIFFHVGDLTLNCDEIMFEGLIDSLKCRNIYLLRGNHNNPSDKIYKREVNNYLISLSENNHEILGCEIYPFQYKNIIFAGNYLELFVDKQFITLFHYPISVFNYMAHGSWNCVGHSHGNYKESLPDYVSCKRLDIGIDVHKKPISFNEVKQIMNKKSITQVDHHGTGK